VNAACAGGRDGLTRWTSAFGGIAMNSAIPPWVALLKPKMSCGMHMWYCPRRQNRHSPHGTICSATTRSPIPTPHRNDAASSVSATTPTNS